MSLNNVGAYRRCAFAMPVWHVCLVSIVLLSLLLLAPRSYARAAPDPAQLELASVHALIVDLKSGNTLFQKNAQRVVPIASVTKLMTAIVVLDAKLAMDEQIAIEVKDSPQMENVYSRVRLHSQLSRREVLRLALMSSENRAAAALAHAYPGGYHAFLLAMNHKAAALGMTNSYFVEPTGLSPFNVSTAQDLMLLLKAANRYATIRELTTSVKADENFSNPRYVLAFYNTNPLIKKDNWDIRLSKTGYTDEAGRCLVMLSRINGRDIGMVFLDSFGKRSHIGDASRVRQWLETGKSSDVPAEAKRYEHEKSRAIHPGKSDVIARQ